MKPADPADRARYLAALAEFDTIAEQLLCQAAARGDAQIAAAARRLREIAETMRADLLPEVGEAA